MSIPLEKLKEIGLREVVVNTHISLNRLQAIVEKNFEALPDRTTTIGLLKILRRECDVEIEDWLKEYEEFLKNGEQGDIGEKRDEPQNIEDSQNSNGIKIFFVVLALVIVVILALYLYFNPLSNIKSIAQTESTTQKQEEIIFENSDERLKELKELKENIVVTYEDNITKQEEVDEVEIVKEVIDKNITIEPKTRIWIGIVFLDNFEKRDFFVDSFLTLDLNRSQILYTGHGLFDIVEGNTTKSLNKQSTVRLHYDREKESVEEIDTTRYKELNRGMDW